MKKGKKKIKMKYQKNVEMDYCKKQIHFQRKRNGRKKKMKLENREVSIKKKKSIFERKLHKIIKENGRENVESN